MEIQRQAQNFLVKYQDQMPMISIFRIKLNGRLPLKNRSLSVDLGKFACKNKEHFDMGAQILQANLPLQ